MPELATEIRFSLDDLLPWQERVAYDPHRFKVIVAGRRSGKSTLAIDQLVIGAFSDPLGMGETFSLYVAPTYSQAEDIAWVRLKEMLRPAQAAGLVKRIYEGDMSVQLRFGQWIQLKGGDKPESLRGIKIRRAVIDEYAFMKPQVWEEVIQPATSDFQAPVMFIGSPCGFNHFYTLAMMETARDEKTGKRLHPDWRTWFIKTSEAGTIPQEEIERARRDMDPRQFRQEYEASFETFAGRVYTDFDRSIHVAKSTLAFNPAMEYVVGMDFGWSAPTFSVLMNIDAQENVFIFAEIARTETPIPAIAKLIQDATPGHMPSLIGCDPAGAAKSEAMGLDAVTELRSIFGYERVRYKANYPGVIQDGINQFRKWLRNRKVLISPACPKLIQALEMYRYPDPKGDVQSELPLKDGISDHPCDAIRYLWNVRFPLRRSTVEAG